MYPAIFEALVECFRRFPGVGLKTAERYAFELLQWDHQKCEDFIQKISLAHSTIKKCKTCGNLAIGDTCEICEDEERDQSIICVVEQVQDIIAMEKTMEYKGKYHVLGGVVSTSKGVLPDDLNIDTLIERIDDSVKEVILATNPTVEGETTALYLSKLLEKKGVTVSRIAHGLPMGGHLDYADEMTLIKALEGRKQM